MPYINRNTAHQPQERTQRWFAVEFLVDDITNWARASELQDHGINPTDVVGQEKKAAFRQIVDSERSDPIKTTNQRPAKEIESAFSGGDGTHRLSFTINACPSAIGN